MLRLWRRWQRIGFIMNFDHVDFPQAVEILARDAGLEVPREESKAESRRQSEHAKLFEVLDQASKFISNNCASIRGDSAP